MRSKTVVILSRRDRDELEMRRRSRSARADEVQRARLILMLADGEPSTRSKRSWTAAGPTSRDGKVASCKAAWQVCTGAIAGVRRRR